MDWQYKREESQDTIPEGKYRCVIQSAEMAESKKGNDMIVLKLALSGQWMSVWYYIVFLDDRPEITNRNLTQLFDSFGMDEGDLCIANWVGKAGACTIKHDEYDGKTTAKVGYFIPKAKQVDLPPWEGDKPQLQGGFQDVGQDDIPF